MNKTKIEWTNFSWNYIVGCPHSCWFCYAVRQMKRQKHRCMSCYNFIPHIHKERLHQPSKRKKPSKIFACSVADVFSEQTKTNWRKSLFKEIRNCPQHIFQILTKQPQNINKNYEYGNNVWLGVTINNQNECNKIDYMRNLKCGIKFVSFEPLLSNIECDLTNINWIIIGKLTGSKKIQLQKEWVANLIKQAREKNIPIFIKDNIKWRKKIQEFPNQDGKPTTE